MSFLRHFFLILLMVLIVGCTTSPLGRGQLIIFPEEDIERMGEDAFRDIKKRTKRDYDPDLINYVECVALHVTGNMPEPGRYWDWEIVVFDDNAANAFALPGAKIGVYTGLLEIAVNQDQLAAVIGHEVAHVYAQHSNERISTAYATEAGIDVVGAVAGGNGDLVMGALGLGIQYGVALPFNRKQETEADLLGLDFMAHAGFDPEQSVALWHNMGLTNKRNPPEFLSTHPSHESRIKELRARMPQALKLYDSAVAYGRRPNCEL